jgi:ABC-type uncharacterized transport system permease subunit
MSTLLMRGAAALYLAAALLQLMRFVRARRASASAGAELLTLVGFAVQAAAIGFGCAENGGRELFGFGGTLALVAWLGAGACVLTQRMSRMPQVAAVVMPVVALASMPAAIGVRADPSVPEQVLKAPLIPAHVVSAALAMALFAIAAGISLLYLLQQRQLKRKQFGRLFARLPPLETSSRVSRIVLWTGLASYGVSFVTGTMAATVLWGKAWSWDAQQVASVVVLAAFGIVAGAATFVTQPRRRAVAIVAMFAIATAAAIAQGGASGASSHGTEYGGYANAAP